jgi:hypothetical protein
VLRSGLLLLALLALLPAANADAAVSAKKAIWGPSEIDGESQFPIYKDLGAGVYQTLLEWDKVAVFTPVDGRDPQDTAYDWPAELDTVIDEAKANGIQVAFTVTGTPGWANGDKAAKNAPKDPKDFADFLTAAAKQYPSVHLWSIWEAPSASANLTPTSAYPKLLDNAYTALKAASKSNKVIGGNASGATPQRWYSKLNAKHLDLFGYNPSARKPPTAAKLKALEATVKPHKLWLGPVELPTSDGGPFRLTLSAQASWLTKTFKLVRADANIAALSYRNLKDEDGAPYRGLLDKNGEKKPSYNAFKRG